MTNWTTMISRTRRLVAAMLLAFVLLVGLAQAASAGYSLCLGIERNGPPVGHLSLEQCIPLP